MSSNSSSELHERLQIKPVKMLNGQGYSVIDRVSFPRRRASWRARHKPTSNSRDASTFSHNAAPSSKSVTMGTNGAS